MRRAPEGTQPEAPRDPIPQPRPSDVHRAEVFAEVAAEEAQAGPVAPYNVGGEE